VIEERVEVGTSNDVYIVPATFWVNGHFHLERRREGSTTNRGRFSAAKAAVFDSDAIVFKRRHQPAFESLVARISLLIQQPPNETEWPRRARVER